MSKRLLDSFIPENYNLFFDIDRSKKLITGTTKITGTAQNSEVYLHQKYLEINQVLVNGQETSFNQHPKLEAFSFAVPEADNLNIEVQYTAPLTDTMMGIYPSYYEVNGEKKQLIGTQFETTAARQAFPSIDEPAAKATFDIAIKFDEHEGETVLSNMPETKTENGIHYFDTTVKMSTYLVAFAFGELQAKYTETNSGVKIGVFGTYAHKESELDFGLEIAQKSIEFFEDYYQTPYPLPHSWQLALPDFSAGAMENWGLVTYREAYLLVDQENASLSTKQAVATVIAHELAHQWFGDLVTMQWWDDLWLNESFANMMEYVAIDAIKPEWKIWESFQTSEVPMSLNRDATDGVQSVHVQVEDPAEIDSVFDGAIVYAKGSRLLVMVRALIGDDALRRGLKSYFDKFKFRNAMGKDLWDALGEASNMDIGSIMNSWLEQPGYPIIDVELENDNLVLSQKQFFVGKGKDQQRIWQIPLHPNYVNVPELMTEHSIKIPNYSELRKQNATPFRLNVNNTTHMIVNYDTELLEDILDNSESIDSITQLQLLKDLELMAKSQLISFSKLVPLLSKFATSSSAIVLDSVYSIVNQLKLFVSPESDEKKALQSFVDKLSKEHIKNIGVVPKDNESNDNQLSRPYVLSASLYAENKDSIASTHDVFIKHATKLQTLPASIRRYVLSNELKNFNSDLLFDALLDTYKSSSDASLKQDIAFALTSTPNLKQLQKIVAEFENSAIIKPQDLRAWYVGVLSNPAGQNLAWDWIRNDWAWLEETVGGDMEFTTFITKTAQVLDTREKFDEFVEFFEPKINTPGLTREITMDINLIESRVNLIEQQKDSVNNAISKELV